MLFISKGEKLNGNPLGLQVTSYSPLDRRISIQSQWKLMEIKSNIFERQFYYRKIILSQDDYFRLENNGELAAVPADRVACNLDGRCLINAIWLTFLLTLTPGLYVI